MAPHVHLGFLVAFVYCTYLAVFPTKTKSPPTPPCWHMLHIVGLILDPEYWQTICRARRSWTQVANPASSSTPGQTMSQDLGGVVWLRRGVEGQLRTVGKYMYHNTL
ncbi:hypothetical protein T440DRAFT_115462 [Plenodomus tracheiphilus IPT5]|uniref:Uncharacterized protein n=1 Tax=Plenodomus tracheiphilus IPT5 TaxID=1408161 RepID=A0A6A7B629_9PLEO|nr:hypothetical protein T440DRAFT_115462 [Plenodomus tracheiphilus IPT5]